MLRSDALYELSQRDIKVLQDYGLRTIVDFRSLEEIEVAPDVEIPGTRRVLLSPNAEIAALGSGSIINDKMKIDTLITEVSTLVDREKLFARMDEMVDQMKELVNSPYAINKYKEFLHLLLDNNNLPVLHHCKGGKDRTGYAALITLLALDVDIDKAREEYMITKQCMATRNKKRMQEYRQYTDNKVVLDYLSELMQTKDKYFDAAIDEMIHLSGSTDKYLKDYLGFTTEKKEALKEIFLEK